jgi:hypothetical protein
MHYREHDFAINRKLKTVEGKNGNKIQPGEKLSEIDVDEIRLLYNCKLKTIPTNKLFQKLPKTRFFNHYYWQSIATVEKCWEECNLDSKCKAITFQHSNSLCLFYSNELPSSKIEEGWTSITSKKQFSQKLPKTRFFGHYKHLSRETTDKCWEACLEDLECKAITFDLSSSNCFFYNNDAPSNAYDDNYTSVSKKEGFVNTNHYLTPFILI